MSRLLRTLVLLPLLTTGATTLAEESPAGLPAEARRWDALDSTEGTAYRHGSTLYFVVDEVDANVLSFPRLANRVRAVYWMGTSRRAALSLKPEPETWAIRLSTRPQGGSGVVVVELDGPPRLITDVEPVEAQGKQGLRLPAHLARTHGEKLRYEPQPHKNTIGYWTNPDDWAEWTAVIPEPGEYEVDLLQGCGSGQGGSRVDLVFTPEDGSPALVLPYSVQETGHFQNFRRFAAGSVEVPQPGRWTIALRPKELAARAVMDVREIGIRPARAAPGAKRPRRPHVLIFLTDDQGTLDAGCYGSRDLFTPYMDGLANDGVRWTQAYAHAVCCPARALLLTGRHPQRSGVNDWMQGQIDQEATDRQGRNMALSEVTLAELLSSHGYRTALFGKWHLGGDRQHGPTRQGFEEFFGIRNGFIDNYNHYYLHREGYHDLYRGTQEVWHPGEYFPDLVTAEAERFLDRHARSHPEEPFFLYVGFNIPHYPEQSDATFDQPYANTNEPRRSYGRIVSTTDDRMGRILARLDEHRWREDTIVLWMSDNGHSTEEYRINSDAHLSGYAAGHDYGAHGGGGNTGPWIGHKSTFYEGGLRVPAVLSYPRILPRGVVRDQIVTAADWYPTICELCGIDPPADVRLDGASLVPIMTRNAPTHHDVLHWQWQNRWAVRQGDWKLIHDKGQTLLVNLSDERPETVDHASEHPQLVERLTALHDEWWQDVSATAE